MNESLIKKKGEQLMVTLGDRVKDPVTGIEGIAYGRISYLQGCDRIMIQEPAIREKNKAAVVPELYHVDEPQLIVTKTQVVKKINTENSTGIEKGGPSKFGPSGQK